MSVLSYLENVASNAVLSETEKKSITTSISTLQTRLNNYLGDQLSEHFIFGSYKRETILPRKMDENSDIDYMVVFADNSYKPQTYLDKLKQFVEAKYSTSEIKQSSPAVILELNHIKFELVPALYSSWTGYQIPAKAADYNDWIDTDPNGFNNKLIKKNTNNNYKIKPMIRIVKYWNAENGSPFYSFSLENGIVDHTFGYYTINLKDYFFEYMLNFSTNSNYPQSTNQKIERTHKIIKQVKQYEKDEMPVSAEQEIKKLIPEPALVKS